MALEGWIVFLSLLGAIDSFYTALQQKFSDLFAFCFTRELKRTDCKEILHSKYAHIFAVPNSWLGAVFYTFMMALYIDAANLPYHLQDIAYITGGILSIGGLSISFYLIHVQAFILKKFCIFCLTSTTIMTIITFLAWYLVLF